MIRYEQVKSIERIRELQHSKASSTWGSGQRDEEGRVILAHHSPSQPGYDAVIEYCSEADWQLAFPSG